MKGIENLKDKLFGLEANFDELQAIDFKKGCFIGQENTARMKLKNKIRKRLFPIKINGDFKLGDEIMFGNDCVGKIIIDEPFPFALIKLYDPDFYKFKDKSLETNNNITNIIY